MKRRITPEPHPALSESFREEKELAQLLVPERIRAQTITSLRTKPKGEFAGLSKAEITQLTIDLALWVGITNDMARKIQIIFADHQKLPGNKYKVAVAMPVYKGVFKHLKNVLIVINRSREIYLSRVGIAEFGGQQQQTNTNIENEPLPVVLDTALEGLIWMIVEELTHAKLLLMAGTKGIDKQINQRYQKIRRKKGRTDEQLYAESYQEMTVVQYCLRILGEFFPDKKAYFDRIRSLSLQTGIRPTPYLVEEAKFELFLPTGIRLP